MAGAARANIAAIASMRRMRTPLPLYLAQLCPRRLANRRRQCNLPPPPAHSLAGCCSSDSRNSVSSRAFSMAMTARSAKLCSSCSSAESNGRDTLRLDDEHADGAVPGSQRRANHRANAGAARHGRAWPIRALFVKMIEIGEMDLPVLANHRTRQGAASNGRAFCRTTASKSRAVVSAAALAARALEPPRLIVTPRTEFF